MNKKEFRRQKVKEVKMMLMILPLLFFLISMPPQQEKKKTPETKEEKVLVSQINSLENQIYLLTKFESKDNKVKQLQDSVKVLKNQLKKLQDKK